MKVFWLILVLVTIFFQPMSMAGDSGESVNGNRIAEPILHDFKGADRTPGFSPITEVIDSDGNSVQN